MVFPNDERRKRITSNDGKLSNLPLKDNEMIPNNFPILRNIEAMVMCA